MFTLLPPLQYYAGYCSPLIQLQTKDLLRPAQCKYVKYLPIDTFDFHLFEFNQLQDDSYFFLIKDELIPGYIWVGDDPGVNIIFYWTDKTTIYRAYSAQDRMVIESFKATSKTRTKTTQDLSLIEFRECIEKYINETNLTPTKFKQYLESTTITCMITTLGREALNHLQTMLSNFDLHVYIAINDIEIHTLIRPIETTIKNENPLPKVFYRRLNQTFTNIGIYSQADLVVKISGVVSKKVPFNRISYEKGDQKEFQFIVDNELEWIIKG